MRDAGLPSARTVDRDIAWGMESGDRFASSNQSENRAKGSVFPASGPMLFPPFLADSGIVRYRAPGTTAAGISPPWNRASSPFAPVAPGGHRECPRRSAEPPASPRVPLPSVFRRGAPTSITGDILRLEERPLQRRAGSGDPVFRLDPCRVFLRHRVFLVGRQEIPAQGFQFVE